MDAMGFGMGNCCLQVLTVLYGDLNVLFTMHVSGLKSPSNLIRKIAYLLKNDVALVKSFVAVF